MINKIYDKQVYKQIEDDARDKFPEESCGFIINDDYYHPCENVAKDKENDFEIDSKLFIMNAHKITGIVHSHINYPHASKQDMIQQEISDLPWTIVNLNHSSQVTGIVTYGDCVQIPDLVGRPFWHGIYDCYAVVRDYFRLKGVWINNYPRENNWWETDENMFVRNFEKEGFYRIDEKDIRPGDCFMAQILSNYVNHSGVILENGIILHHLYNRLSKREPMGNWRKFITHYLRKDV